MLTLSKFYMYVLYDTVCTYIYVYANVYTLQ